MTRRGIAAGAPRMTMRRKTNEAEFEDEAAERLLK